MAIRLVVAEDSYLVREALTQVLTADPDIEVVTVVADVYALHSATERELEVLALVATGKSNAAIASALFLTKRAIEKHINAIFLKLDLRDTGDVSRRVKAALIFLAEDGPASSPPA